MKRLYHFVILAALLLVCGNLKAQIFYYDFEQCNVGDKVAETLGEPWTTWNQNPGSVEDAMVSDEHCIGTRALKIDSHNDLVLKLGDKTSGAYSVSLDMYIPEGKEGYFNILHEFAGTNSVWAFQMWLNSEQYGNSASPGGAFDSPAVPLDEWFNITVDIYLDNAVACVKLNGEVVKAWDYTSYQEAKYNCISAMNFFATSSDESRNGFYVDNVTFEEIELPSTLIHSVLIEPETMNVVMLKDELDTVVSKITNNGNAILGSLNSYIDFGVGPDGGEETLLHYDSEPYYSYGFYATNLYVELGIQYYGRDYVDMSMAGMKITKMQYYVPLNYNANNEIVMGCEGPLTFRVYKGLWYYEGFLLAEKVIDDYTFGWNTVELDEPVPLGGYPIYATVGFQQIDGLWPISLDAGPVQSYTADLVQLNHHGWFSLNDNNIYYGGEEFGNNNIRLICEGLPVATGWVDRVYPFPYGYLFPEDSWDYGLVFNTSGLEYGEYDANLVFYTLYGSNENYEVSIPIKLKVSGTDVGELTEDITKISPNPTKGIVTIEAEGLQHINVYNILGQLVENRQADGDVFECDLSSHEAGIYLIRIETANGIATKRVVLTK